MADKVIKKIARAPKGKHASAETWALAKGYFECGKSLKDINYETGIDAASISKRAKRDGWEKGKFQPLIADSARMNADISRLEPKTKQLVEHLIDMRTRDLTFFDNTQRRFAALSLHAIEMRLDPETGMPGADFNLMELAVASRVVKEAREGVVGKNPDTAIQINNSEGKSEIAELVAAASGKVLRPV